MASTTRLLDRATISTISPIGTTIHGVTKPKPTPAPAFISNPEEGPTVVDTSSPAITVLVKGKEITRTIIDGG